MIDAFENTTCVRSDAHDVRQVRCSGASDARTHKCADARRSRSCARQTPDTAAQGSRLFRETLLPKPKHTHTHTHTEGNSNNRQSFPKHRPLLSRVRKNSLTRSYRDQGGMDDFRRLSEERLFFKRTFLGERLGTEQKPSEGNAETIP